MDSLLVCRLCGRKMSVYSTRKITVGTYSSLLRRRKCPVHDDYRTASVELPKDLAIDVLSDD